MASGPAQVTGSSAATPEATGSESSARILTRASERYRAVVGRYQELYTHPSRIRDAIRLLSPMERSFERWAGALDVAIEDRAVQISADAQRAWVQSFGEWLDNQALRAMRSPDALAENR